jgi:hypothetical protein
LEGGGSAVSSPSGQLVDEELVALPPPPRLNAVAGLTNLAPEDIRLRLSVLPEDARKRLASLSEDFEVMIFSHQRHFCDGYKQEEISDETRKNYETTFS